MQQWDVVVVIGTLAGLFASIIAPVVKLTKAITRLTAIVEGLEKNVGELTISNRTGHERLWNQAREHEKRISDHETRLRVIEEER